MKLTRRRLAVAVALMLLTACAGSGADEEGHGGSNLEPDATLEVPTEPGESTVGDGSTE